MKCTPRQLAKLRTLGRAANELELRHTARRDAIAAQREYVLQLKRQIEHQQRTRDAALVDVRSTERSTAIEAEHNAEIARLEREIETARAELDTLHESLAAITAVSAPLRDLIERVLRAVNLDRARAGIDFGAGDRGAGEHRTDDDAAGIVRVS